MKRLLFLTLIAVPLLIGPASGAIRNNPKETPPQEQKDASRRHKISELKDDRSEFDPPPIKRGWWTRVEDSLAFVIALGLAVIGHPSTNVTVSAKASTSHSSR